MKKIFLTLYIIIVLLIVFNINAYAITISGEKNIYSSQSYSDLHITGSGILRFYSDVNITVNGDAVIEGYLSSRVATGSTGDKGSSGEDGSNGTSTSWAGKNGSFAGKGKTGGKGKSGYDLLLNVNGTLRLTGTIALNGGKGGTGGKGGSGGDGGDGYKGSYKLSDDIPIEKVSSLIAAKGKPNGGTGGKGGSGGTGGIGGDGGDVIIKADKIDITSTAILKSIPGLGGTGGSKGSGGDLGEGGVVKCKLGVELVDTVSGRDGSKGSSGTSDGGTGSSGSYGVVKLFTPNLIKPSSYTFSDYVHVYTDTTAPKIVNIYLNNFDANNMQIGPNPEMVVKVQDLGNTYNSSFGTVKLVSGVYEVSLVIRTASGQQLPKKSQLVTYKSNEAFDIQKTVKFNLNELDSGNYSITVVVSHRNNYSLKTVSKQVDLTIDKNPPIAPSSLNFTPIKTSDGNLRVTWNPFADNTNIITYNYKLRNVDTNQTLVSSSVTSNQITYATYLYNTTLDLEIRAIDAIGNESQPFNFQFVTFPEPPEIVSFIVGGNINDGYQGELKLKNIEAANHRIEWQKIGSPTKYTFSGNPTSDSSGNLAYTITNWEKHGTYKVYVRSINKSGVQSQEIAAEATMPNNSPIIPANFVISPIDIAGSVNVEFCIKPFIDQDNDELSYYLTIEEYQNDEYVPVINDKEMVEIDANKIAVTVGLQNDKKYRWKVKVKDNWSGVVGNTILTNYHYFDMDMTPPEYLNFHCPDISNNEKITISNIDYSPDVTRLILVYNGQENDLLGLESFQLTLDNVEGSHKGTVIAYDAANNPLVKYFETLLDKTKPNKPILIPDDFIINKNSIKVIWQDGGDGIGSGVVFYQLAWQNSTDTIWNEISSIEGTSYNIGGLTPNQKIRVKVLAIDHVGYIGDYCDVYDVSTLPELTSYSCNFDYTNSNEAIQHYAEYNVTARAEEYRIDKLLENGNVIIGSWQPLNQPTKINVSPHESYQIEIFVKNTSGKDSAIYPQIVSNNAPYKPTNTMNNYINSLIPELEHSGAFDVDGDTLQFFYTINTDSGEEICVEQLKEDIPQLVEGIKYFYNVAAFDGLEYSYSDSTWFIIDKSAPSISIEESIPDYHGEWVPELSLSLYAVDSAQSEQHFNSGVNALAYTWNDVPQEWDWQYVNSIEEIQVPHGISTFYVKALDNVGNVTTEIKTNYYRVDQTPPDILNLSFVEAGSINGQKYGIDLNTTQVSFEIEDQESELVKYNYALITADEISLLETLPVDRFKEVNISDQLQTKFNHIIQENLVEDQTYYLVVKAENSAGRQRIKVSEESIVFDVNPPIINDVNVEGVVTVGDYYYLHDFSNLNLKIDVKDTGVGLNEVNYGLIQSYNEVVTDWSDALSQINFNQLNGNSFYIKLKAVDKLNHASFKIVGPFIYDNTAPKVIDIKLGNSPDYLSNYVQRDYTRLNLYWTVIEEDNIPLKELKIAVGRSPLGTEVSANITGADADGWLLFEPEKGYSEKLLRDLDLIDGSYYLSVTAINVLGLSTTEVSKVLIVERGSIVEPVVEINSAISVIDEINFKVSYPDYLEIAEYKYWVMTQAGEFAASGAWSNICTTDNQTAITVNLSDSPLEAGKRYFIEVEGIKHDGFHTPKGYSNGVIVDLTPPIVTNLIKDGYLSGENVIIEYKLNEDFSEIKAEDVEIRVGSNPDLGDVTNGWITASNLTRASFSADLFKSGEKYFIQLRVKNVANLETISNGSFTFDNSNPLTPVVIDFADYARPTDVLKINWQFTQIDPESGLKEFLYAVMTSKGIPEDDSWQRVLENDLEGIDIDDNGVDDYLKYAMEINLSYQLEHSKTYYVAIKSVNKAGLASIGFSDGITIDNSAPLNLEIDDQIDYVTDLSGEILATFYAEEPESEIDYFQYKVGTVGSEEKYLNKTITENNIGSASGPFVEGDIIFFQTQAINSVGLVSEEGISDGILVDTFPPVMEFVKSENPQYSPNNNELIFYWKAKESKARLVGYEYLLTTDPDEMSGEWTGVTNNRVIINSTFTNGATYYLLVRAIDAKGFTSDLIRSPGITIDSLPPEKPVIIAGETYRSEDLVLSWSRGENDIVGGYRYAISSFKDEDDITNGWIYLDRNHVDNWEEIQSKILVNLDASEYGDLLKHDKYYYFKVQAFNRAGLGSEIAYSEGFKIDKTSPLVPIVNYQGYRGIDTVPVNLYVTNQSLIKGIGVTVTDEESGVVRYKYQLVKDKDKVDFTGSPTYLLENGEFKFDAESFEELDEAGEYFVAVSVENAVGLWSDVGFSPKIIVDTTPPELEFLDTSWEVVTNGEINPIQWKTSEKGIAEITLNLPFDYPSGEVGLVKDVIEITSSGIQNYTFSETFYGIYQLSIVQKDEAGNESKQIIKRIRVNEPPVVEILLDQSIYQGRSIKFNILYISDPDYSSDIDPEGKGPIVSYQWKLADGTLIGEDASFEYTFNDKGVFEVVLTVFDVDGGSGQGLVTITVTNTLEGELLVDEIWEDDLVLKGTVIIPLNRKLIILPGVNIIFRDQSSLNVSGSIIAKGEELAPIIFGCENRWEGVIISNSYEQEIDIDYLNISSAVRGLSLLDIESPLVLEHLSLTDNEIGLHLYNTNLLLKNCRIENSLYYGIKEDGGSETTVVDCIFNNNGAGALYDEEMTILEIDELVNRSLNK